MGYDPDNIRAPLALSTAGGLITHASPADIRVVSRGVMNPESGAAEVYEEFHGRPSDHIEVIEETEHWHEYLGELGELQEMKVNTLTNLAATFNFSQDPPALSSSEDRTSMYLVGGDQSLDLASIKMGGDKWRKDKMVIGVITQLTYRTEKGFDKFKKLNYYHDVGEESGVQPLLVYRTRDKRLEIVGGQYLIEPRGIVN
jgi:hypothetical protein